MELIKDLPSSSIGGSVNWVRMERLDFLYKSLFEHECIKSSLAEKSNGLQEYNNAVWDQDGNDETVCVLPSSSKTSRSQEDFGQEECFRMFEELDKKSNTSTLKAPENFYESMEESDPGPDAACSTLTSNSWIDLKIDDDFNDYSEYKPYKSQKDIEEMKKNLKQSSKFLQKQLQSMVSESELVYQNYKSSIRKAFDRISPEDRKNCYEDLKKMLKNFPKQY